MGNLNASFQFQTLDGTLNNIVGLSLSQTYTETGYTESFFETFEVPPVVTDQQFNLLALPNQVIVLMNIGTEAILYRLNSNTGTQISLPASTGFAVITTTTPITSLYLTNQSATILSYLKVLLIG